MSNPSFSMAAFCWRMAYTVALYLATPWILLRHRRQAADYGGPAGLGERFGFVAASAMPLSPIWIHAVSVGEVNAARPLLRLMQSRHPGVPLLLTTTTVTAADVARRQFGAAVTCCYMPYDLPGAIARFLRRANPRLLLLMETELWPNLLSACRKRQIPVVVVNARLSAKSAAGYARASALSQEMLQSLAAIAVQTRDDSKRYIELGADPARVSITGSIKFDVSVPPTLHERGEALRQAMGARRKVWVAGSTRDGEEALVLAAASKVLEKEPETLLILAPRHPERVPAVLELCKRVGASAVVHSSANGRPAPDVKVYIIDTMGDLLTFYAAADIAFVGGSLVDNGGQNVIEPASVGRPIICGPSTYNFAEVVATLRDAGALVTVGSAGELASCVVRLLCQADLRTQMGQQALHACHANRGAVERTLALVESQLKSQH
ncbi:MAG: lipid IV(A) 3-deoxy-D-manno-octulosonic acid transferase [Gammaproteobacteria bacterium]|nr:lipid IV(A) 3-deoxy-D-manno-octulosonic acid transferase [Gammaproteobacteria bacterium]